MRRRLVLGSIIAGLLSCGVLGWALRPVAPASLIVPDAQDVRVQWHTLGRFDVQYQTSGAPFAWRRQLSQQLDHAGWRGHSYPNIGASRPPFSAIWFTRTTWVGPIVLIERVVFSDRSDAPLTARLEVTRTVMWGGAGTSDP